VVWRDTLHGRKGRAVIDIRGLNEITDNDNYSLPLQSDIIASVASFPYISTVDAVDWFHQFNVKRCDRFKFTVVSHRGQEESSVALYEIQGISTLRSTADRHYASTMQGIRQSFCRRHHNFLSDIIRSSESSTVGL
jgi:hypothetical protein